MRNPAIAHPYSNTITPIHRKTVLPRGYSWHKEEQENLEDHSINIFLKRAYHLWTIIHLLRRVDLHKIYSKMMTLLILLFLQKIKMISLRKLIYLATNLKKTIRQSTTKKEEGQLCPLLSELGLSSRVRLLIEGVKMKMANAHRVLFTIIS
jgi:hypothetical protein